QLFKISADGQATALTPDTLEMRGLLCQTDETAYVSGWQDNPLSTHVFKVNLAAPKPEEGASLNSPLIEQVSQRDGQNFYAFNGDCSRYLGYHNSVTTPPQLRAYETDGEPLAWLNENALNETHPYAPYMENRITPEFGQIAASDGTKLDYKIFKPKDMKPGEKRASVTIVYNGPGVQRVSNQWGGNDFANMLAHHGFVVFFLDGRGATNRGKAFEDVLYRAMGKAEVIDQSTGADWLKSQSFIDPDRMGIYGWSYGGYMSLHMLAQTNQYASGVAGAPVTDWALYDTAYTERYLGSPNPKSENYTAGAYENNSVFTHLDGLTEPMLLIHGMADDNVVFRHSIKLMDAMQKRGAHNMRLMTYPGEKHGFRKTENRIHRDRQILEFFLDTLDIQEEQ
ncbi:MAG: prolyl oligopeptidase family serine peptidase, partial [Litorimonas sp.]